MKSCNTIDDLRVVLADSREKRRKIGFVPTMGALHEGHISLARQLKSLCDVTVCSVFVNPLQFNDRRDYEAYSINLERDRELLESVGIGLLFTPAASEIYPTGCQTTVFPGALAKRWEGEFRPGHFEGMATVVLKLLNIVSPDIAIFGEKDFQQLRIVEQMVKDFNLSVLIVRGELIRDTDGLALSSRNVRLSSNGRIAAKKISAGLNDAKKAFLSGELNAEMLKAIASETIRTALDHGVPADIEYLDVVDEESLEPVTLARNYNRILTAVQIDGVRLLDNIAL